MKPILFSTPMVQAILDDRKTQTRRVINPQPMKNWMDNTKQFSLDGTYFDRKGKPLYWINGENDKEVKPKYELGDILYVRETWASQSDYNGDHIVYKADFGPEPVSWNWKPSIFMPKEFARIFLQVTDVRAEKLHDITEEDAKAEGAKDVLTYDDMKIMKDSKFVIPRPFLMHQFGFMSIWCKINGVQSWDSNPWVWVYSFKKIQKP